MCQWQLTKIRRTLWLRRSLNISRIVKPVSRQWWRWSSCFWKLLARKCLFSSSIISNQNYHKRTLQKSLTTRSTTQTTGSQSQRTKTSSCTSRIKGKSSEWREHSSTRSSCSSTRCFQSSWIVKCRWEKSRQSQRSASAVDRYILVD